MNSTTLDHSTFVDLEPGARLNRRRWWKAFLKPWRPRRRVMLEHMYAEHLRLVKTLDRINERLDGGVETAVGEDEAVPVFEGIRQLTAGQDKIGSALVSLEGLMERGLETDTQLAAAVEKIDRTLLDVREGHTETTRALEQVRDHVEASSHRLESALGRLEATERRRSEEFRQLKSRVLIGFGLISAATVAGVALLVASPWS